MGLSNLLSIVTGLLHFLFGVYTFRLKGNRIVQNYFLLLNFELSLWLLIQGFRVLVPLEYRNLALNLNFIPILFVPFTLYVLCKKLENSESRIPIWASLIAFVGLGYFVFNCVTQRMANMKDQEKFVYEINVNYHLYVLYLIFWTGLSIFEVSHKMLRKRGDFRVRLFFFLIGAILALHSTTFFVYILPLFGIFKPWLSSIGLLISCLFWGIAILHFDAFEIKAKIIGGADVPLIHKAASWSFLRILARLDPMRFIQKSSKEKAAITKEILIQDYDLTSKSGELSVDKRAELLSKKFGKYFK
ncbi:LIC10906 family membrane protein [Leptospira sanjuanensis]|uniref:LIC10906 family membrane protein n=1 Tax=Leptospira sanjuanensis TaxID=2879643 RepID=UPI0029E7D4FD|nr:histidine kinase N-terminal 7TM domain-containing protein [Leptospira sanjuanensis]